MIAEFLGVTNPVTNLVTAPKIDNFRPVTGGCNDLIGFFLEKSSSPFSDLPRTFCYSPLHPLKNYPSNPGFLGKDPLHLRTVSLHD